MGNRQASRQLYCYSMQHETDFGFALGFEGRMGELENLSPCAAPFVGKVLDAKAPQWNGHCPPGTQLGKKEPKTRIVSIGVRGSEQIPTETVSDAMAAFDSLLHPEDGVSPQFPLHLEFATQKIMVGSLDRIQIRANSDFGMMSRRQKRAASKEMNLLQKSNLWNGAENSSPEWVACWESLVANQKKGMLSDQKEKLMALRARKIREDAPPEGYTPDELRELLLEEGRKLDRELAFAYAVSISGSSHTLPNPNSPPTSPSSPAGDLSATADADTTMGDAQEGATTPKEATEGNV